MKEKTLEQFYHLLNSDAPTPGGGAIISYVLSLAVGLSNMSILISKKRKSFLALDESIQNRVSEASNKLTSLGTGLLDEIQNDVDAFNHFMVIYKLKPENEEEQLKKEQLLDEASNKSILIPVKVLKTCIEAYDAYEVIEPYVVKSIISDLIIGVILLDSCIQSSIVNIKINLPYIKDENLIKMINQEIKIAKEVRESKLTPLLNKLMSKLEGGN
ncbi:TPA: cyclodeaminase/cyclohydrolase family protein [bacterium]|jgi:formiminotetrahydrofolate cyclodeaminase|nr:cyclodeaminase/cyclohydrolase family protein [bacterium]